MCDIAPICGRNVCFCTFVYFLPFVFCFHESVLYLWDLVFYLRDSFYICVIRFIFVRLSFLFVRLLLYLCDSLYICAIRFVFVRGSCGPPYFKVSARIEHRMQFFDVINGANDTGRIL